MLCSLSFSQTGPREANPYGWFWGCHTALRQNSFSINVYTAEASESTLIQEAHMQTTYWHVQHFISERLQLISWPSSTVHSIYFLFSLLRRITVHWQDHQVKVLVAKTWLQVLGTAWWKKRTNELLSYPLAYTHTPPKIFFKKRKVT